MFIGSSGLELAIAGGGAVIFSLFIVFDTQASIILYFYFIYSLLMNIIVFDFNDNFNISKN